MKKKTEKPNKVKQSVYNWNRKKKLCKAFLVVVVVVYSCVGERKFTISFIFINVR